MAALAIALGVLSIGVLIFRQNTGRTGPSAGGANPATGPAIESTATSTGQATGLGEEFESAVLSVSAARTAASGDCLTWVPAGPGPVVADEVACSELHRAEVTEIVRLADRFPAWPGVGEIEALATRECPAMRLAHALVGGALHVAQENWEGDARVLVCVFGNQRGTPWSDPAPPSSAAA